LLDGHARPVSTSLLPAPDAAPAQADALAHAAAAHAEHTAVVDRDGAVSYRALDAEVARVAGGLATLGVRGGDVVAFQLPNWTEAVVAHHAIRRLGAISNPIVPIYRDSELRHIQADGGCRVLLVPGTFRGTDHLALARCARADAPALEHVVVVDKGRTKPVLQRGEIARDRLGAEPAAPSPRAPATAPALLLYTSGTTAQAKGVLHTGATLDAENRSIVALYALGQGDVVFMASPLAHITGVLYGIELPALLGATVVLQDRWQAATGLALIRERGATFTVAATPFLRGLLRHTPGRRPAPAAARLRPRRRRRAGVADPRGRPQPWLPRHPRLRVDQAPTVTACGPKDAPAKSAETDGRPLPGCAVRVVDEDGRELPPGQVGDLLARGP
jgi:cyclohexanecarboxylate-CoA ligase